MKLRARAAALLALVAAVGSLVGLAGEHGHALGEVDLAAHSLVAIGHAPVSTAHFDRAVEIEHPSCGACLQASLRSSRTGPAPAALPLEPSRLVQDAVDEGIPVAPRARRAPARAPPLV